jgi:hypothetical protein
MLKSGDWIDDKWSVRCVKLLFQADFAGNRLHAEQSGGSLFVSKW